jgi:hypothetical protein
MPNEKHASTSRERFTPAMKACRDRLVDDVDRHLGVPIIGTPARSCDIGPTDVAFAVFHLRLAVDDLRRGPTPVERATAVHQLLEDVSRYLGAPSGVVLTTQITPRQITLARQRLHAAIVHLTELLFADDI